MEFPKFIAARVEPVCHYELHFKGHVEFWTLQGECLGKSKVVPVE